VTTILTTDTVNRKERASFWRDAMSATFVPLAVGDLDKEHFAGFIRSNWIGRLMIAELESTAQDVQRTKRHISHADAEYFQIAVIANGIGRVLQDGREAVLRAGDCAIYETTRPFEWAFDAPWSACVFTFPRSVVQLTESQRRLLTAQRLDAGTGITGVMSRFLLDVARHNEQLSGSQAERVLLQATDLVLALLGDRLDGTDTVRSGVQRTLMLRIKDHIQQRLADAELTPTTIASSVNVSTRYLHKLFEAESQTVTAYIRQQRLDRCRHDLLDQRFARQSIAAIAFRWGFGDLSGFNRAFKASFGITPSDIRGRPSTRPRPNVVR
jgi:AraC-like DNA-binding protein